MAEGVALAELDPGLRRRSLRSQLGRFGLAEDWCLEGILGADETIDLVAREPNGRVALILVARPGDELAGIASALAQRAFVAARLGDWKQLAPDLPLRPDLPVRAILLGHEFGVQARAAVQSLGESAIELWRARAVRGPAGAGPGIDLLLESLAPQAAGAAPVRAGAASSRPATPPLGSVFRGGLGDAELGLSPEELREFD